MKMSEKGGYDEKLDTRSKLKKERREIKRNSDEPNSGNNNDAERENKQKEMKKGKRRKEEGEASVPPLASPRSNGTRPQKKQKNTPMSKVK
mmetsp:Transcript_38647/g.65047  ORF Transcript_38647/g.65047 Transcript_38647/m.65047 type:complete len:91 (+) Transcript_38647:684-956(+)